MNAQELKQARETLGLTQAEFAEALGLGAQARISKMENGGTITRQTAAMVQALLRIKALDGALGPLLRLYVDLGNSGDAGFWDPEEMPEVIAARAALNAKALEEKVND